MKNIKKIAASLGLISVSAILCCGCNQSTYKPEEGTSYYKYGDTYRIIEMDDSATTQSNEYALNSFMMPATNSSFDGATYYDDAFMHTSNSLFFSDDCTVTKDGVVAVYNYLNISNYQLDNEPTQCNNTGLYSFNSKVIYNKSADINMSDYPDYTVLGEVGDVDIYTFKYRDVSARNGKETGNGQFKVIYCAQTYISTFTVNK